MKNLRYSTSTFRIVQTLPPVLCLLTSVLFLSAFTLPQSLPGATAAAPTSGLPSPSGRGVGGEGLPQANTAYNSGDFQAAEKLWRRQLATAPTDWTARHNLSLALAQQDRWPESAAQAVAAFVQQPDNPAVRRNVINALARAGYAPAPISEITRPGPVSEVALRLSPARWQSALALSITLAALALALLLARAYTPAPRRPRLRATLLPAATALFVVAVLGTLISLYGLHAYGPARDARAVLVWKPGTLRSIPTVADTTQKTTPLPAGTIAIADKTFPGWLRLTFPNGQTGWTPVEDTVALWK